MTKVKTYPRLAKLIAVTSYTPVRRVDEETKIRAMALRLSVFSKRDRKAKDWDGLHDFFGRVIHNSFKMRHHTGIKK